MHLPDILLVHGAWHGSWCWELVTEELRRLGRTAHTVDLPSSGTPAGLHEDAETIRRAIAAIDRPVAVVGHSYGGFPVTEATAGSAFVTRVVYLAAWMLEAGTSISEVAGLPEFETELVAPPPDAVAQFYDGVDPVLAERAAGMLRPQSARSATDRLRAAGWLTIPSTYLVCDNDKTMPPAVQEEMAARASSVHHLPASHSPFLSMPADLAALLDQITLDQARVRS
ncbi:alpha/beta fold hydrolase [Lentzea sp. NEAU-D7]|uniref:alpha/beta fold hydrolase n=1 Tax=Lentzea sp. NEAU-D7 TaxID=2994667 RepID=UPI00224B40B7|nr:alpha/beta fold hydrolase [Lentzea sp. NEAU-D7]MCX2955309.1 alpha/beta fold hydrolase [Lentzea sp. NEAU-D7]